MSDNQQIHVVIQQAQKNPALGAVLGFLFGPLGMIYSTPIGAAIMIVPYVVSAFLCAFLIGFPMLFACGVASAIWSYKACEKSNQTQTHVQTSNVQPLKNVA